MKRLEDVCEKIHKLYQDEGLKAGCLEGISFSGKWTTVFGSTGQNGMAFNFTGEHSVYGAVDPAPLLELQWLVGKPLTNLTGYLSGREDILYRSLFLAALNALSVPLNQQQRLLRRGVSFVDAFDFVKNDDFVTVVGAGGVVGNLQKHCDTVHVLDMRPKRVLESVFVGKEISRGPAGLSFHDPSERAGLLAQADIVFMTGCTLVNETIFELLPMIKKARVIGVFGPSAMLAADVLGELGVNYIQTVKINDPEAMKGWHRAGGGFREPQQVMESYMVKW